MSLSRTAIQAEGAAQGLAALADRSNVEPTDAPESADPKEARSCALKQPHPCLSTRHAMQGQVGLGAAGGRWQQ